MNQKRLLYAGAIFVALILLTYGLNLTTLSIFIPTAGKEYQRGDVISFKTELAGKVAIPAQWGSGCGDLTKGTCWTFDQSSFLADDLLLEVRGVDTTTDPLHRFTLVNLRSSSHTSDASELTRGYGLESGCIYNLIQGYVASPVNCPGILPVGGEARILKGTKAGLISTNANNSAACNAVTMAGATIRWDASHSYCEYTLPFEITTAGLSMGDFGKSNSGFAVHVAPVPAGAKTGFNIEMQIVSLNEQADAMWVLDACVASKNVQCTTTIEEVLVPLGDTDNDGTPDALEDTNANGVPDIIDDVLEGKQEPISVTQNPLILLAFAVIAYFASGYLIKK